MKVLIIEDDRETVEYINLAFKVGWPTVKLISTSLGEEGIELVERESPDVVILDLGLPDIDGSEALKRIRLFSMVPIIIMTVRTDESDIVKGLEWGADEYVVKPFGQMELLARVKAVLRRQRPLEQEPSTICGPFRFSYTLGKLNYGEREIRLTSTEGLILHHLAANAGKVVTHPSLAEAVWGEDYPGSSDSLKVYVRRLRQKIETDPSHPKIIITRPGLGYLLAKKS